MTREKILLTSLTYPLPSTTYEESFCTAGFKDDGSMIRIYPVPFYRYKEIHKYSLIELDIIKRKKGDKRPESYSPANIDLKDLKILSKIGTEDYWSRRREYCLKNVYENFDDIIKQSREPEFKSLAVFKPKNVVDFIIEEENEKDWKPSWKAAMDQYKIFNSPERKIKLEKIPYKFKYHFFDSAGKKHKLQILDWEIGALYRNCLKTAEGNEQVALEKVKQKYWNEFINLDLHFFVGTTLEWHLKRAPNPFVIIGVFYPPLIPLKLIY
ncbi:MAG: hypothetical protein LWX07_07160 [Bacteroidetes bacterium]|nr:hypothetical protein [Bacteroidota bacterium]